MRYEAMTGLSNEQLTELVTRVHAAQGAGFASRGRPYALGLFGSVALVVCLMRTNITQAFAGAYGDVADLPHDSPGRWTQAPRSYAEQPLGEQRPTRRDVNSTISRLKNSHTWAALGTAVSIGHGDTMLRDQLIEDLDWFSPVQRLAWSAIQFRCYFIKFLLGVQGQVGAFREVLPEQPVGVLVGAALPR